LFAAEPSAPYRFGDSGTFRWIVPGSDDTNVELLTIAARRVGPVEACCIDNLCDRPLLEKAVLEWGQEFLQLVYCGGNDLEPHTWQALQRLPKLATVAFFLEHKPQDLRSAKTARLEIDRWEI
jgi:hypothetical protein